MEEEGLRWRNERRNRKNGGRRIAMEEREEEHEGMCEGGMRRARNLFVLAADMLY
jgi:hypothetical protein